MAVPVRNSPRRQSFREPGDSEQLLIDIWNVVARAQTGTRRQQRMAFKAIRAEIEGFIPNVCRLPVSDPQWLERVFTRR